MGTGQYRIAAARGRLKYDSQLRGQRSSPGRVRATAPLPPGAPPLPVPGGIKACSSGEGGGFVRREPAVWSGRRGGGGSWCRCDPRSRPWPGCLYSGSGPLGPPLSVTGGVVMEPGRVLLLPPRGCVCSPGSSPVGCPGRGSRFCVCPLCHRVSPPTPHLGPGPPQPGRTGVPRPGAAGAGEVVVRLEKSGYGVGSSGGMWEVVGVGKPGQVGELGGGRVSRVPQQWGPSSGHPRCWGEPGL